MLIDNNVNMEYIIGKRTPPVPQTAQQDNNKEKDERKMSFEYGFYELSLIFLFWGIVGWMIEGIDMRIEAGEFQNRGFLHMPLCPIYGTGMAMGTVFLDSVKNSYLILFVFGVVFCSAVEYIVGGIMEKLFHSKWWDYSHMRYNIKGRVCLRNAVLFGFGAILVFGFVEPEVEKIIARIPAQIRTVTVTVFGLAFAVDMVLSARRAWSYREMHEGDEPVLLFKAHR